MKDISPKMQEILMDCHEREILKMEPLGAYYGRYSKGLLERGLISPKTFHKDGKTLVAFYITRKGIEYLAEETN